MNAVVSPNPYPSIAGLQVDEVTADSYLARIVGRVHHAAAELFDVSPEQVDAIVSEALFQIARDIRRGRPVLLESLGEFLPLERIGQVQAIVWRGAPSLFEPLPDVGDAATLAEAVFARAGRAGGGA